jgi:hypothetical protein
MRKVGILDEVSLLSLAMLLFGLADDQLNNYRQQLMVVVSLANKTVHDAAQVDLPCREDWSLVVLKLAQEVVQ